MINTPRTMIDRLSNSAVLRMDLQHSLAHELGHYIVAHHFKGNPRIRIWRSFTANVAGEFAIFGNCTYGWKTPYQRSCVGWSGEIGKNIFQDGDSDFEELHDNLLMQWEFSSDEFSSTDLAGINAYKNPERSLKRALNLLLDNTELLISKVEELSERFENRRLTELYYPE